MCCAHRCSKREPSPGARHAFGPCLFPPRPRGGSVLALPRERGLQRSAGRRAVDGDRAVQPAEGSGGVREVLRGEARAVVHVARPGNRGHARGAGAVRALPRWQAGAVLPSSGSALGLEGGARQRDGHPGVQGGRGGSPHLRHRRLHGAPRPEDQLAAVRVAILSARQGGGWHTDQLCRALAERGHEGRVLSYEALVARFTSRTAGFAAAGEDLASCGAVLARIIPAGSLEQIIFRMDALHALEERGIPVINSPRAIERTVDKLWTTALLQHAGLPVPETVVCEDPEAAITAFRALGDVIVKPLFGSMGLGMVRVTTEEMAFRVFRTLETLRSVSSVRNTRNA